MGNCLFVSYALFQAFLLNFGSHLLERYFTCLLSILTFSIKSTISTTYSELNNTLRLNNFTGICLFLKSQKYFLNISLFEGVTLQNVLVINGLSSFRKVAAKLA